MNTQRTLAAELAAVRAIQLADTVMIVTAEELALLVRYAGATSSFRTWLHRVGIEHLPDRPGHYDMKLVRNRLDAAQGLLRSPSAEAVHERPTPLELRRQRNAQK